MSARRASSAVVDDIGGAGPVAVRSGHAHIEGAVGLEGEAARGVVELHRGDADVEHDAVARSETGLARDAVEIAEAPGNEGQAARIACGERGAGGNRGGIAVEPEYARIGRGGEDGLAVAAGAEGGVNVGLACAGGERLQHLGKQHGNMARCPSECTLGRWGASRRHYSRAPPSPPLSP